MMKRIFTLSLLMIAFVMNAVAQWNQDAKIEEVHWFGMHEFYNSPIYGINNYSNVTGDYLTNANFFQSLNNGWLPDPNQGDNFILEATNNTCHIRAWGTNFYAQVSQTTPTLQAGKYRLTYQVRNDNNNTTQAGYGNEFYVQVGETKFYSLNTEWKNGRTDWITHTIEFRVDGTQSAKINFGYGLWSTLAQGNTPDLYVRNLTLDWAGPDSQSSDNNTTITWSDNYLESLTVVKDWTGQTPRQRPKTSFYSWLDHELRFSVGNTSLWWFGSVTTGSVNNDSHTDLSNYYGLKNFSDNGENFTIHHLKQGDQINIEYNTNSNNNSTAKLKSGNLSSMSVNDPINSKENNELKYYTVSDDGDVCIEIPGGAVIRAVRIILKEYQVADMDVTELNTAELRTYLDIYGTYDSNSSFGYRYTFKNSGVLEDKRGAVPYITMKFGNDNDMTFVRALADVSYEYGSLKQVTPKLYTKNAGESVTESTLTNVNGEDVYVIHSHDRPIDYDENNEPKTDEHGNTIYVGTPWDTQFWIGTTEYSLPAGQKFKIKFDYKADQAATVTTQTHGGNAGPYIHWACIGDLNFTTSWQTFEQEITLNNNMGGWMSVAFNLNELTSATNYYFKNITLEIPERTEEFSPEQLAATSIVNKTNEWNPDKHQYHIKNVLRRNYDTPTQPYIDGQRSAAELQDMFVGKEWSVFTAEQAPDNAPYAADTTYNGQQVVWRDIFNTIYPLSGNYFYFFPEVDGTLAIDYYCEGAEENTAFWWKENANGDPMDGSYQGDVHCKQFNSAGNPIGESIGRTNGSNHYYLTAQVKRGCVYYFCSLPTNNAHEHPIIRLKSYAFMPDFYVTPLYKVVSNTEVTSNAVIQAAEIKGGPYPDLNGQPFDPNYDYSDTDYSYELTGTFTRNAEPEARVKCLGNVVSAKAKVEYNTSTKEQWLYFYNIKFREGSNPITGEAYNPGGAVVAHVNGSEGAASVVLTIAYDAAQAKWNDDKTQRVAAEPVGNEVKTEVKRWDFYSGKGDYITKRDNAVSYNGEATGYTTETNSGWDLGKHGEDDGTRYNANEPNGTVSTAWKAKSKLFKEVHKADGQTADWEYDYVDVQNKKEPLYKSIYDMAGDNADMIHETAGLVFFTDPNELGIWNENDAPTSSFEDRFIGLMGGGKLIIPRLKADDRVVIKMGCFGNTESATRGALDFEQKATLWLTNAKDAKGTVIPAETNYVIGGSMPFADETVPRGEYHFMVANTSTSDATDFAIEVKDAALLKIYSIVIYRNAANNNADILTENEFAGDKPEILYTDKDNGATQKFKVKLNYSGFEETQTMDNLNTPSQYDKYRTGKFKAQGATVPTFSATNDGQFESTTAIAHDMFGTFRSRIGVQTRNNTYITDYADGDLAVGYRETKTYPYTWDFTDLKKYVGVGIDTDGNEKNVNTITVDNKEVTLNELKLWNQFGLRVNSETATGTLFVSGGQLYGDQTMFEETAGIGIGYTKSNAAHNEKLTITGNANDESGALAVSRDDAWTFTVPDVAAGQAVYVHATPADGAVTPQYAIGNGTKQDLQFIGTNAFAMKMADGAETADVKLYFQGCGVNKIAVSDAPKKLNAKGWATESREYVTDPALASYMTGKDIRTYLVTGVSYKDKQVTLTRIDNDYLMTAAEDGDENACIILNFKEKNENEIVGESLSLIDGGFHLFAPDMHDYNPSTTNHTSDLKKVWTNEIVDGKTLESLMVSQVSGSETNPAEIPAVNKDEDSKYYGYTNFAFTCKYYDINPETGAILSGVKEGAQAFYRIAGGENGKATSKGHQGYLPINTTAASNSGGGARFSLLIVDGSEVTGISSLESVAEDNDRFYNLNGQQLSGKPNRSGLYIVNGKKVYIKNK